MLAPWNPGHMLVNPPARGVLPPKTVARLRQAVVTCLASSALFTLAVFQGGCDNPASKADKEVRSAVNGAADVKHTLASDASVASAVDAQEGSEGAKVKAKDALPVLGAYDSKKEETVADWIGRQGELPGRSRGIIAAAMRVAARGDQKAARDAIDKAATTANATPDVQVDPYMQLADMEMAAGDDLWADAAAKEIEVGRLASATHRLLGQVRLNNAQNELYKSTDPQKTLAELDAIQKKIAGADASADWMGMGESAMPAEAKVDAKLAEYADAVKKSEGEKAEALEQAKKLDDDAAKIENEARTQTGDLALNKSLEAAKMHEQAAELRIKADAAQAAADVNTGNIAVAQTRKPVLAAAQKSVEARKQSLTDHWLATQDLLKSVNKSTADLLGFGAAAASSDAVPPAGVSTTAPVPAPSEFSIIPPGATTQPNLATSRPTNLKEIPQLIKDDVVAIKLARMKAVAEQADTIRKNAADLYLSAIAHNGKARDAAKQVTAGILARQGQSDPRAAERATWATSLELFEPAQFDYRDAVLHQRLAALSGDRVRSLAIRVDLREKASVALKGAAIDPLPMAVTDLPTHDADVVTELKKASDEYTAANTSLTTALNGGKPDEGGGDTSAGTDNVSTDELATAKGQLQRAARGMLPNMYYSWMKLLMLGGDTSAAAKGKAAESAARQYNNMYGRLPPGTPPEMYDILKISTTLPSTSRPSGGSTTAPTPGGVFAPTETPPGTVPPPTGPTTGPAAPGNPPPVLPPPAPADGTTPSTPPPAAPTTPPADGTPTTPAAPPPPATTPPAPPPPAGM